MHFLLFNVNISLHKIAHWRLELTRNTHYTNSTDDTFYPYDLTIERFDEDFVIPIEWGDSVAVMAMWEQLEEKSDQDLKTIWDALSNYSPRNYWSKEGKIGMDRWAEAVCSVMNRRGLSTSLI